MAASIDLGYKAHAGALLAHIEGAHALWSIDFVAAEGHQIDGELVHVHRNLTHALGGVTMKHNPLLFGDLADFGNGIDGSNLIVRQHDGNQNGFLRNRVADVLGVYAALFIDGQVGHLNAALL